MTPTTIQADEAEQIAYRQAVELLRSGQVPAGAQQLQEIGSRTRDDQLRSQCFYNLGEVLCQLQRVDDAYRIWYSLAHKPPHERNHFDHSARAKVMQIFDAAGLRLPVPDFPPKVQIEVTNRCNLRCVMCTRNQMERGLGDLSLAHLEQIADQCAAGPGCTILLFFLGEPLLHEGLEEMVAYLASVRDRTPIPLGFGIQTNGMLLSAARARRLIEAGLRQVYFSVDGLEGDLERIRPGAEYPVVEQNILGLLALREELGLDDLRIHITKLCDDRAAPEVERFVQRWEQRVDGIELVGITKVPGNAYLDAAGEMRGITPAAQGTQRRYCGQGQRLLVLADGRYAFCCGDVNGELDLGHVEQRSIREVWQGPEIQRIRAKVRAAEYADLSACEKCPLSRAQAPTAPSPASE